MLNSHQQVVESEICGAQVGGVEDLGVLGCDTAFFPTFRKVFIRDKDKITALLRTLEKPAVVA